MLRPKIDFFVQVHGEGKGKTVGRAEWEDSALPMFSCGPRAGRRTGQYAFGVPRTASDEVYYGKKTYMIPMQNRRIWIGNLVPEFRQAAGRYFPQRTLLPA